MLTRWGLALLCVLGLGASAAQAEWINAPRVEDPFKGPAPYLALNAAASGDLIVFRCTAPADVSLSLVSPKRESLASSEMLKNQDLRLLVIVDEDPVQAFAATVYVDHKSSGDIYFAKESTVVPLLARVRSAKRRIAIAVEADGHRTSSVVASLDRASDALDTLVRGCGL